MNTDGEALLRAVLEEPADDLPRLALADWFDERGEADRAEFIRCQLELARIRHRPGSLQDDRAKLYRQRDRSRTSRASKATG